MKVRKYYSKNQVEGFLQVRKELGPEAIILQTRKVRHPGLKGLFLPPRIEIIAALDLPESAPEPPAAPSEQSGRLEKELDELKKMIQKLMERPPGETEGTRGQESRTYWRNFLQKLDLDPVMADDLLTRLSSEPDGPGLNWASMVLALQEQLNRRLTVSPEKEHRILVLVGPTGVGKTTTLAKLAARYALTFKEKVGLITVDHFRIGAVEQLKAYAEIIDLPLETVIGPADLSGALERLADCDRILVDTAGRSTGSPTQIDELAEYIELLLPAEIHLVISATTRWQDIRRIAGSFSKLQYNRLLVTKLDETTSYGAVLNGAYHTNRPLVYLTDGQSVPDCLKLAREMDWAELFLGGGGR